MLPHLSLRIKSFEGKMVLGVYINCYCMHKLQQYSRLLAWIIYEQSSLMRIVRFVGPIFRTPVQFVTILTKVWFRKMQISVLASDSSKCWFKRYFGFSCLYSLILERPQSCLTVNCSPEILVVSIFLAYLSRSSPSTVLLLVVGNPYLFGTVFFINWGQSFGLHQFWYRSFLYTYAYSVGVCVCEKESRELPSECKSKFPGYTLNEGVSLLQNVYHFFEDMLEAETATITQPTSWIVAWEPSDPVRMSEWSLISAFFLMGKTSTISFLLLSSAGTFVDDSLIGIFSDSNIHSTPWWPQDRNLIKNRNSEKKKKTNCLAVKE